MAAVDGTVFSAGGLPPVARTTAAITATRQASQPRMKARPLMAPLSAPRIRTNADSGNGSRVIARPMSMRSSTIGAALAVGAAADLAAVGPGQAGAHRSRSAVIRPADTASTRA